MYEFEAQPAAASITEIPSSVRAKFAELARRLDKRTLLPWSEDCSENVAPTCYSTCSFYTPRPDLKCRRFAEGIVRLDFAKGLNPYIMKVTFRLWGMLSSPGNVRLLPLADARWHEDRERRLATLIRWMPLGFAAKLRHAQRRHFVRNAEAAVPADDGETPSYFLIEVYNPGDAPADLTVIMRPEGTPKAAPFQTVVTSEPGYRRIAIDAELIGARIDLKKPFRIDIIAEHREEPLTLYFGAIDFVADPAYGGAHARACLAVIWELDNVVWKGVLAEQGAKGVKRRDDVVAVIRELSSRGIRHAVVSRNDAGEAEAALQRLRLGGAFVAARYGWGPKSHAIGDLVTEWGISREQLIVVEDLAFDRAELVRNCPGLRVIGAAQATKLPVRRECQGDGASQDGAGIAPSPPQFASDAPADHDIEFLREIDIRFSVTRTAPGDLKTLAALFDRAHLTGIGGKRLRLDRLRAILKTKTLDAWTLECRDRFGDHGIIGWCVVDKTSNTVVELVFSREIVGRRLELAMLNWLVATYASEDTPLEFFAAQRPETPNGGRCSTAPVSSNRGATAASRSSPPPPRGPVSARKRCGSTMIRRRPTKRPSPRPIEMLLGFGSKMFPAPTGEAIVSFTFDDFPHSALAAGGAILKDYGVRGTFYAAASLRDAETEMGRFYTAEDLVRLVADGHELGCQGYSQIDCGRASGSAILADVARNGAQISAWLRGYQVSSFAYPRGRASLTARRVVGRRYATCRGTKPGINGANVDLGYLRANRIGSGGGSVEAIRELIAQNTAQRGWLIFHTRDVSDSPSDQGCTPRDFEAAVKAAVKARSRVLPMRSAIGLVAATI